VVDCRDLQEGTYDVALLGKQWRGMGAIAAGMVMRWSGVITPNTVRLLPWVECREECEALHTTFSRPPADLRSGFENSF